MQPLLHGQQERRTAATQWLMGLGFISALGVAVATLPSTTTYQYSTGVSALRTIPQTAQVAFQAKVLRAAQPGYLDSGANRDLATGVQGRILVSQNQVAAPVWLASMILIPLSVGALAWKLMTNKKNVAMASCSLEKEMKVWNPINNKKFETFSYLPPLSDAQIAKQVDMIIAKGLSPCLEFAAPENSFTANDNTTRFSGTSAGYYDNRYWTMWKLPMFGCSDASQVLREISECRKAYPQCFVRLAAFDSIKQVQVISFLVQRPSSGWSMAAVSGEKEMKVWNPINNKKFETFSYLPPLSDSQIAKQVDMIIAKGLSPCLEFAAPENSFTANDNTTRFSGTSAGYYDNRYWTMWKLPMFGCSDASQVLREISECRKAYPQSYVRLAAFDSVKQVQVISFLVQRPSSSSW